MKEGEAIEFPSLSTLPLPLSLSLSLCLLSVLVRFLASNALLIYSTVDKLRRSAIENDRLCLDFSIRLIANELTNTDEFG